MSNNDAQSISENILLAKNVVVLLPKESTFPSVASGLAIYLALKNAGKSVDVACVTPMIVDVNRLVGIDQIKTKLSGRNLVISFDYVKDAIEKVSYNVEDSKFNLVIQPKEGHSPLSADKVMYSYSGANGDVIILIGTTSEAEVAEIITEKESGNHQLFSLIPGSEKGLISETLALIGQLGLKVDQDIAGNLYQGLLRETDQFVHAKAADFETAAVLKRAGANPDVRIVEKEEAEEVQTEIKLTESKDAKSQGAWFSKPKIFRSREDVV